MIFFKIFKKCLIIIKKLDEIFFKSIKNLKLKIQMNKMNKI